MSATDLLVLDAGHTRTKFAACRVGTSPLPEVFHSSAQRNDTPLDWLPLQGWLTQNNIEHIVVTGTNFPRARQLVDEWPTSLPSPLLLDRTHLPLRIDVDVPERVGIDRLLNAIAANAIRQPDQPVISVDTGTAITVDVVSGAGEFLGGAILPGLLMGARSLHEETTTLPHLDVWELLKNEPLVLGKNTEAAIAAGLYWGHLGAIRELITRYRALLIELRIGTSPVEPLLVLTGGAAGILAPYLTEARYESNLALQGLALAAMAMLRDRSQ